MFDDTTPTLLTRQRLVSFLVGEHRGPPQIESRGLWRFGDPHLRHDQHGCDRQYHRLNRYVKGLACAYQRTRPGDSIDIAVALSPVRCRCASRPVGLSDIGPSPPCPPAKAKSPPSRRSGIPAGVIAPSLICTKVRDKQAELGLCGGFHVPTGGQVSTLIIEHAR